MDGKWIRFHFDDVQADKALSLSDHDFGGIAGVERIYR